MKIIEHFAVFKNKCKKTWIIAQDITLSTTKGKIQNHNAICNCSLKNQLERKEG